MGNPLFHMKQQNSGKLPEIILGEIENGLYLFLMRIYCDHTDQLASSLNSHYTFYPEFIEGEFIEGFSGKERDRETGLSYFGARYYDSDLSIWLSADPLMSKYPSLSPYTYCSNNPIMMLDPDGRENIPALNWARANMSGNTSGNKVSYGRWFGTGQPGGWGYKQGTVPSQAVCYDACFIAYMNSSNNVTSHLKETGFATKDGGFRGRLTKLGGINWFKNGDGSDRSFVSDIGKGELGDIIFMGDEIPNQGHAALLNGLPVPGSYTDANGNTVETMMLNTLSTGSYTGDNHDHFGEKSYTFEKQKDGTWKDQGANGYIFKGYGQLNSNFSKQQTKTPGLE